MTRNEEELAKKFLEIANEVTEEMVLKAALEMPLSYQTVKRYLKGLVGKENVGKKLLEYFETKLAIAA